MSYSLEQAPVADKIYDHPLESVQTLLKNRVREKEEEDNQGATSTLLTGSKSLECRIIDSCVHGSGSGNVPRCVNI